MEIRPLTENDVETFWQMRLRSLRECPEAYSSSYEDHRDWPMDRVLRVLRDRTAPDQAFVLGAFEDGLLGMVGCWRQSGVKVCHKAAIWGAYVSPEARGRGIARQLMLAAIERARQWPGCEQVQLAVVCGNAAARHLYLSLGFRVYGLERRALKLGDRYLDEEQMTLDL